MTENQDQVLCAANSYIEKFYLNEDYKNLPEDVKQQLQIICVAYTEDVGGVLVMKFSEEESFFWNLFRMKRIISTMRSDQS